MPWYNRVMDIDIARGGPDDFPQLLDPVLAAFGDSLNDEQREDVRLAYDDCHFVGARSAGRWVGTMGAYPFEVTLPGRGQVAAAGLTMVGVLPTHRRRGITTRLMDALLDDAAGRGDVLAVLLAMEAPIYGRFGFGVASEFTSVAIEADRGRFAVEPVDDGELVLCDPVEGSKLAEEVWDRQRLARPGAISRRPWMWELWRRDREDDRKGDSALFWAVHLDASGSSDGYATYRISEGEHRGLPRYTAKVVDLVGTDADVEAILLRFLCSLDLVREVEIPLRPVDDPLRLRLVDGRQLQVTELGDFLWARILDVPRAFGVRRYPFDDALVVEVEDRFRPEVGGRFLIAGGPDSARCERTDAPVDIELGASELASLLFGAVAPSVLADAGRLRADDATLARADAFFTSTPKPFNATEF